MILGVDTSNIFLSFAIERDGALIFTYSEKVPMRHSEVMFLRLRELMHQLDIEFSSLDRIGVSIGPGMFTGLRVGLALAKGIAYSHSIPVVPVNTLDALAHPYLSLYRTVIPITDARRGLLYAAVYQDGGRDSDYLLVTPEGLKDLIPEGALLLGDGLIRYPELVKEGVVIPDPNPIHPEAKTICHLARIGEPVSIDTLEPFYLKKSDAEIDHPEGDETRGPGTGPRDRK